MYALPAMTRNQRLQVPLLLNSSSIIAFAICLNFIGALFAVFCAHEPEPCWLFILILLGATASNAPSAEPNWAGDYADKNFLRGQAAFQMTIEQSGNSIELSFDAAYIDAHGAAPDGGGHAKITGKNALQFNWEDSFNNSGTGTIRQTGDGIIVSMKTTRVVDSRCLVFYGENMQLKRVKK
jgi:hypothetical protein